MTPSEVVDNELDLQSLFCALWRGKFWIAGGAGVFAVLAFIATLLMVPQWSATALTDRPTVNLLEGYYAQRQFLTSLDSRNNASMVVPPSIMDDVYKEFVVQLAAYDTRRDFWLSAPYYHQRKSGSVNQDAVLLEKLTNAIVFQAADSAKNQNDSIRLSAENAGEANTLLRDYIAFANRRAATHLHQDLTAVWSVHASQLKSQILRQETVAKAMYDRRLNRLRQALDTAQQQGLDQAKTSIPISQLTDSSLFLLGRPLLQAQLASLQAAGPDYDREYDQNRAMLSTLDAGSNRGGEFATYRFLRTPEEPVKQDSPRRLFLMLMWGTVGAFIGAGIALIRRPVRQMHGNEPIKERE